MSGDLLYAMLGGAAVGTGLLLLVLALRPARVGIAVGIARLDASRRTPVYSVSPEIGRGERVAGWRLAVGSRLAAPLRSRDPWLRPLRSDLALLGRSLEAFLASAAIFAGAGLLSGPVVVGLVALAGSETAPAVPATLALTLAVLGVLLPVAAVRREATRRRRDFRHAVGAFLDLVSMNLAGGRGVPEALTAAAEIGGRWPFARLRDTLAFARLQGLTPWAALGRLGEEVGVDELRDLAAALTLVADDGARVRASLAARAATLRRRELAEMEGKAGERSQSMLVAQMLIVMGYLLFLAYPAASRIL
jgi:tight adherence protein C